MTLFRYVNVNYWTIISECLQMNRCKFLIRQTSVVSKIFKNSLQVQKTFSKKPEQKWKRYTKDNWFYVENYQEDVDSILVFWRVNYLWKCPNEPAQIFVYPYYWYAKNILGNLPITPSLFCWKPKIYWIDKIKVITL